MKKMSKKIVFFGNERLATGVQTSTPTLRALISAGYDIVAVVSNFEPGQSRSARGLEIKEVADENNIPLLLPSKLSAIKDQLREYDAQLGVLVAYGKIVPQSIIDIFPLGIVNIHPSLLPLHRGPTPIESVILEGAKKTGVSIMQLAKEMDAGPIFGQSELRLNGHETKQTLADDLLEIGKSMLLEILPSILDGSLMAIPQDESSATYDNLLTKEDGVIDWHKHAAQLEREVRAFIDWPKSRTTLGDKDIVITNATVIDESGKPGTVMVKGKELIVCCGEKALKIDRLKPAGKNEMTAQAFLAGHRHLL